LSGTYDVNSTSARPVNIVHSTMTAPSTMSQNIDQPSFGAGTRLFRRTGPAKYSTAISKKMMKKMSMLIP
jgi:hypothetical protein